MLVLRRDALGRVVAPARAFGVAVLAPLFVRLAERIGRLFVAGAVVAFPASWNASA